MDIQKLIPGITLLVELISFQVSASPISQNWHYITPTSSEECSLTQEIIPPENLMEENGRLLPSLRQAAQKKDPLYNLAQSALAFSKNNPVFGNAYADLAVSGRESFETFKKLHQKGLLSEKALVQFLPEAENQAEFMQYASKAIERSYSVANALMAPQIHQRKDLGWIAISSEDDQAHHPVNAFSSPFTQRLLPVPMSSTIVDTRYIIAPSKEDQFIEAAQGRNLWKEALPSMTADSKVLLYIHGMDSSLEEAHDLTLAIHQIAKQRNENWIVISMDLPTSGYATKLDPSQIATIDASGKPRKIFPSFNSYQNQRTPLLDFMENFVLSFVDTLEKQVPLKDKIVGIVGGSLGGNLGLRLGQRKDIPWLKNIIAYSPASVWESFAGNDLLRNIALISSWRRSGGNKKELKETEDKRDRFFDQAFGGEIKLGKKTLVESQPSQWWSKDWPCFEQAKRQSRLQRHEIYNKNFRLWHWRLAMEQLLFSHISGPGLNEPRYIKNHVNTLLACGLDDNFAFAKICDQTIQMAKDMHYTPGKALFFEHTGHSIHNERPLLFAQHIIDFLSE